MSEYFKGFLISVFLSVLLWLIVYGICYVISVVRVIFDDMKRNKSDLLIESPSRVFSRIGVSILSGFILGQMKTDVRRVTEYKRPYTYRRYYTQPYEPVDKIRREMSVIKDCYD